MAINGIYNDYLFNKTESNTNQIIIKLYNSKKGEVRSQAFDTFPPKRTFKITEEKQINSFDKIFDNAKRTDYCCCPTAIYSVAFFDKTEQLDIFYVDTIQIKDSIRFYEKSFQYSYIVEKQKWKNYLAEIGNGN